jgi:coenzyme F420-reducing hydrogenase beta subunit
MEQESEQGSFTVPISKAQEMTEAMTGVKVHTVQKIKSEGKSHVTTVQGNRSQFRIKEETTKEMSLNLTSLIYA